MGIGNWELGIGNWEMRSRSVAYGQSRSGSKGALHSNSMRSRSVAYGQSRNGSSIASTTVPVAWPFGQGQSRSGSMRSRSVRGLLAKVNRTL
ncbi:hypothetical protein [Moorena producens]|uniref:hypothetical protein n=1 Tax=Moorena producens TaxID=1155739 RepID=UPI003C727E61